MRFREELIQVAAVAVAIVEDLDYGSTGLGETFPVLTHVHAERLRQEDKWGPQHHTPIEWLAILTEEVGEAAEEIDWLRQDGSLYLNRAKDKAMSAGRVARHALAKRFGTDMREIL